MDIKFSLCWVSCWWVLFAFFWKLSNHMTIIFASALVNFLITSLLFSRMLVRNLQLCFGLVVYHPPNLNCFSDLLNKQMARILIRWVWTQVHLQVLMLVGKVLWTYFPKHLTAHQVQKRKKLLLGEWQVWFC